jgi:hypothetical protein
MSIIAINIKLLLFNFLKTRAYHTCISAKKYFKTCACSASKKNWLNSMATTPLGIDQAPRAQSRAHVSNNVWPHGLTPPSRGLRYSPALGPPTPRTPAIPGPPVPVGAAHGPFSCSSSAIHAPPRSSSFRFLPSFPSLPTPPHLAARGWKLREAEP